MFRKTGIGLITLALLVPGIAAALGVGDYELNSYLNQPLDMRVKISDTGDLAQDEILVELASDNDYERSGAQRSYLHSQLNFEVELDEQGQGGVLHITTDKPVREPYINFVTEVLWPTGRILREFTVLLDPPTQEQQRTAQQRSEPSTPERDQSATEEQTATESVSEPVEQREPVEPTRTREQAREPVARTPEPEDRSTYKVKQRDTMWQVALNHRPDSSVSVQQMLSALKELNQDAFIDGNVNLVREGAVLRIPTQQEIRAINTREAMRNLASQNQQWREMLRARGIDPDSAPLQGTPSTAGDDRQPSGDGEVQLVTESGESADGSGAGGQGGADSEQLENELAIREEKLDRLERENQELSSRLDELEEQVDTSDQLLQLREQKIAQLQQELKQLSEREGVDVSDELMEPVEEPGAGDAEQQTAEADEQTTEETAAAEEDADQGDDADQVAEAGPRSGGDDGDGSGQPGEDGDGAGDTEASGDTPADEAAEAEPAERAGQQEPGAQQPAAQPSMVEQILNFITGNLLLIGVGLVVLLALVVAAVLMLRRGGGEPELPDGPMVEADEGDDFLPAGLMEDDDEFDFESGDEGGERAEPAGEGQDPLEEADLYVVYGRHKQAVDYLRGEIEKAPERDDLKIRQLDILGEMQDPDAFEKEAASLAGSSQQVDNHIETVRNNLGAGAGGGDEPSLDDLEMDLSSGLDEGGPAAAEAPAGEGAAGGDDDLDAFDDFGDFDLSLDESDSGSAEPEPASGGEEDDFAFDFSGGEEETTEDNSLDFEPGSGGESDSGDDLGDLEFSLDDLDTGEDSGDDELLSVGEEGAEAASPEPAPSEPKSDEQAAQDVEPSVDTDNSFDFDLEALGGDDDDTEELTLEENVSSEFSEASEEPAADDLDLSLEDLDTGEEDESAADNMDTVKTEALDELDSAGEPPADPGEQDAGMDLDFDATDLGLDEETQQAPATEPEPAPEPESAPERETAGDGGAEPEAMGADELLGEDDDFDFLGDSDENATKLDLAKAYIDMGDNDGARDILNEVLAEGTEGQQGEARELLSQVG